MPAQAGAILVVDDDPVNRTTLSAQLEMEGYAVAVAAGGRAAIGLLRAQPFDVVLLDLMMPEMDGFQVLEQIKADHALRTIPVIVISALEEMEFIVRSIEMGATDHLPKPCNPFLLRARVNASLAAKHLHDQEAEYLRHVAALTDAAAEVEAGRFDPASLTTVASRTDALGQLARVFQRMAAEVVAREQSLKQQNQFKSALIGKITHELRSPLAACGMTVQVLERYAEREMVGEMREQIELLDRQLAEGRQMIDSIITFASLVGRQANLCLEEIDMAALVREVVAPLETIAAARGVTVSVELASPLPRVRADRRQIGEAIHHLVLNAIKFNREQGLVRIGCWPSPRQLVFVVEDTGRGVDPDKLDAIWEAFAQDDDVRHGAESLGLGLALVKTVVQAHDGIVFAKSAPGEGSVFGFRLPAAR